MKLIMILGAALLCFTAPAFSELTVEDIEKIRSIVKEETTAVKEETTASETRVKEYRDTSERIHLTRDCKSQHQN